MWDEEIEWIWNKLDVPCKMILPWIETTGYIKIFKGIIENFLH